MKSMNDCVPWRYVGIRCSFEVEAYQRVYPFDTLSARPVIPSSSESVQSGSFIPVRRRRSDRLLPWEQHQPPRQESEVQPQHV